ncbi:MAG: hypothetical protein K0S76_1018 [Herbinix sp.]|nr:hypothetical protein [Herbinix sp.]
MIHIAFDGSLKFDTQIDTEGFARGTNTIKSQANGMKSTLLSLGKTMALVFGVRQLVRYSKQAIDTASDLQEVQNVVDTAFGDMAYKMEDFAKTSIDTFGLSKLAAKEMGSLFMAMSTGMGQASDTASDMAVNITGRLADIMSFYNKTKEEVQTIGKAIYTGETEPLKAIGLVATETNLSLFALQKGFKTAYSEMAADQKLLVRQLYFMEKTSLAAGDFAKTSGSWANQTRVLTERWKEFLGLIGQGLIQVLTPAVRFLNTAMSYMISMANAAGKVLSSVFGLGGATDNLVQNTAAIASGSEDASAGLSDMGKSAKKASKDAKGSASGFDQINNITDNIADNAEIASDSLLDIDGGSGIGLTPEIGSVDATKLEKSLSGIAEKIKSALQPSFDAFDRLKTAVSPFADNVGQGLRWLYDNVLVPFASWTVTEYIPAFLDNLGATIGVVSSVIEVLKPLGVWLWENFLLPIATWTGGLIIEILNLMTDALNNLSAWILNNQEVVANAAIIIGSFFAAFGVMNLIAAMAPLLGSLAGLISSGTLLSTILSGIGAIIGAITSPITIAVVAIGLLIYSFIDLYNSSESFRQSIADLGQTWLTALQPLADFVGTVLTDAWEKILKPVIDFFVNTLLPNLIDTFKNLWENILVPLGKFIGTVLQPVFKVLSDLLKMLWEKIVLPLANAVGGVLKKAWDGIYQILNKTVIPIFKKVIEVLQFLWEKVINPIIKVLWDTLKPAFDTVFSGIGEVINGLGKTLGGIIDFITGVFTGDWKKAWEGIKDIFGGVWDALVGVVKIPINLIIDLINGLVGGIVKGINAVIKAINSISFDMPDWLGGGHVGFNLKELTAPKIPKLATGTVVPANYGEFLAVLGDNKREPEIVSPTSAIEKALENVMNRRSGNTGEMAHFTIKVGNKAILEGIIEADKEYRKQTGKSAFAY